MNLETRVGYKTISILQDEITKYIKAYTTNGRYKGDVKYLILHQEYERYLRPCAYTTQSP